MPITATRQAICLQPLLGNVVGLGDCTAGVFLSPTYDPVRREIIYRQRPDQPPLTPGTTYQLTAYVAINPGDNGLLSFDGVGLDSPVQIELGVLPDPAGGAPWDLPPTGDLFCTAPDPACTGAMCARPVAQVLGGCAYSGCHGGARGTEAEGLRLGSPVDLLATAIGRAAHETETGEHAREPDQDPPLFGRAMPVLDPQVAGNSYLVYKLLASRATPLERPFAPDPADPNAEPPEIRRLRASVVVGMPMPPLLAGGAALRPGEAERISAWLMAGAQVPSCP